MTNFIVIEEQFNKKNNGKVIFSLTYNIPAKYRTGRLY